MQVIDWVNAGALSLISTLLMWLVNKTYKVAISCQKLESFMESEKEKSHIAEGRMNVHDRLSSKLCKTDFDSKQVAQGKTSMPSLKTRLATLVANND